MSANDVILVVISGLGVIHGLFLAIFLWNYPKGNALSNRLLSLLLATLSIRVGKSVFLEFTKDLDTKIIFTGLSLIMIIGPLFYFFCRSCVNRSFYIKPKHLIHFIPAILGFIFGLWLNKNHLESLPIILFAILFLFYYIHLMVYLLLSNSLINRELRLGLDLNIFKFLRLLFFGLLVIWAAYVLNLFDDVVPYIVGPILYSVVAYVLTYLVFKNGYIQKIGQDKYKTTPISKEQQEQVFEKVKELIIKDKQYRDPDLTLKSLSEQLKVSTQILSLVINQSTQQNFNTFINGHRINEAIDLFQLKEYENLTIASIAFEVGFNSISSFNTAFKKQTGDTPQSFRNQLSE